MGSEWEAAPPSPICSQSGSPATRATKGLAPGNRQPRVCDEPIGRVAAPTFFWGGEAAKATGRFTAARLILMGVWRDSSQP